MGRAAQRARARTERKRGYAGKKADPFYLSESWRRLRREVLERDHYLCQRCQRAQASVVHHIIPRKERPDLARVMSNLESVCDACH
ncbi:MAG: HNH endonuclease, partial [Aristaeellaceae bacterium]